MTDITNLVLQELAPEKEDPKVTSVLQIYKTSQGDDPQIVLDRVSRFLERNEKGELHRENIVRETAILVSQGRYRQGGPDPFQTIILAIEYQEEGGEEHLLGIIEKVEEWKTSLEKRAQENIVNLAVGTTELSLDYLSEIFGDDTTEILVDITGKKAPTVKRWLRGGNCTWGTGMRINRMAKNFYTMKEDKGWSNEEIRAWLDKPLSDGNTPRHYYREGSYYNYNQVMRDELQRIENL